MPGLEDLLTGQTLVKRYRIGEVIGRGGFAVVYRAEDVRLGRPVAVKVITIAEQDPAAVALHRDRFEQEADGGSKRSAFAGKGKYWERYREHFEGLNKDPDDCFRRLFGDEFARAYEEQLSRLKSARRMRQATHR